MAKKSKNLSIKNFLMVALFSLLLTSFAVVPTLFDQTTVLAELLRLGALLWAMFICLGTFALVVMSIIED